MKPAKSQKMEGWKARLIKKIKGVMGGKKGNPIMTSWINKMTFWIDKGGGIYDFSDKSMT